jgi:hypothetical protein
VQALREALGVEQIPDIITIQDVTEPLPRLLTITRVAARVVLPPELALHFVAALDVALHSTIRVPLRHS